MSSMRILGLLALGLGAAALVGCGNANGSGFDDGGTTPTDDATTPTDDSGFPEFPDTSVETAPPCTGLKCQEHGLGGQA